jgi:16S rRNA (guanine527-N7)-methyltransferase
VNEVEALGWLDTRVPRETIDKLRCLIDFVRAEAAGQNLIAASTLHTIWARHVVDSAQLLMLAPSGTTWIDLGAGAGFPGLVVGLLGEHSVVLAEARAKRIAFLQAAIEMLDLQDRVTVAAGKVEALTPTVFDIISARAFAPLSRLFSVAQHLAGPHTRWVLPKGRSAKAELDDARGSWQGGFRIVPSITDPEAAIIIAEHVRPIGGRRRAGSTT